MSEPQKALPVWKCDFAAPASGEAMTVGTKFNARCTGDIPVTWTDGPLSVVFPSKEGDYTLAILETPKLESQTVDFVLTGYKAGDHKPEYVRFVQGENGFEIQKPTWNIQSVLKQGEENKPFGPFGPWSLNLPFWIFIVLAVVLTVVIFSVARFFRRRSQRLRMLAELEKHKTALSPVHQFYRDARQLRRRISHVKAAEEVKGIATELNREFRLYILREFQIPTLDWSNREILQDLRSRFPRVYRRAGEFLSKTLRELGRMNDLESVPLKDIEQMYRMSMDSVEKLDMATSESKAGGR